MHRDENLGYIHLYTGNGKGKTTAAIGLAIRAAGAGKKVFIGQFVKGMHYSEIDTISNIENITLQQFGRSCFIERTPDKEDIAAAQKGLEIAKDAILHQDYQMVILDEICIALYFKLFSVEEVVELLQNKPKHMEIVLTGRNAPPQLMEVAHLVTEMKEVKHYYNTGVAARKGIEF